MVFQSFSSQLMVLLAYALSVNGLAIPVNASSLETIENKFLKLDFVVNRDSNTSAANEALSRGYLDIPLTNAGTVYSIVLNFGTDAQPINVTLDTGSSDLWVPSVQMTPSGYDRSKSSDFKDLGEIFQINYVVGSALGEWATDLVTIPDGPSLQNFQFAEVADYTTTANSGILGVGLASLEQTSKNPKYPNFPAALKNAGITNKNAYSLYLNDVDATTGSIIFGGIDTEKYLGDLVSLSIIEASERLEVTLDSITATNGTKIKFDDSVVLDTGATLSYLPSEIVQDIVHAAGLQWLGPPINTTIGVILAAASPLKELSSSILLEKQSKFLYSRLSITKMTLVLFTALRQMI